MRNILFVIGSLDVGGAERHLLQLVIELKARGWLPEIFCLSQRGVLAEELEAHGIPVHIPMLNGRSTRSYGSWTVRMITTAIATRLFILRRRPDVIHYFLPQAYLFGSLCALFTGKRISLMSRRSLNYYMQKRPLLAIVERWMHKRMDMILGNSQAVLQNLREEGVPEKRLGLIYNGLDITPFSSLPEKYGARAELALPVDALILVMVANLIPYKGHADLIDALGSIRTRLPSNWKLLCVGRDDGILPALQERAKALGIENNIVWLGSRRDVPMLLAAADIGLLVSHEEGFSNAILEAMASGLPMVVTNVGGNAEAVVHGETGLVVPAKEPILLGEVLLKVALNENRQAMGHKGQLRVKNEFSLQTCVDGYELAYRKLIAEKVIHSESDYCLHN